MRVPREGRFSKLFYGVFGNERYQRMTLLSEARDVRKIARGFEDFQFRDDLSSDEESLLEGDLRPFAWGVLGELREIRGLPLYFLRMRVSDCRDRMSCVLESAKSLVMEK